jgi:predicted nuclease of predicted toxin-antitoxin system
MESGISDEEILEIANHQGMLLLTSDKDFGELVFRDHRYTFGIVLIRLFGISTENKANKVNDVIKEHGAELVNSFTVINLDSIRIRPRLF